MIGKKYGIVATIVEFATSKMICIKFLEHVFDLLAHFFGASLHIVEHAYKVSAKDNDHYPDLNTVLCLPLNNSTSILCSNT